jgi:TPR repeat protein
MAPSTRIAFVVFSVALVLWNVAQLWPTPEIDALRARAEAGDAEAQYNLGLVYATGMGVPENDVEAAS